MCLNPNFTFTVDFNPGAINCCEQKRLDPDVTENTGPDVLLTHSLRSPGSEPLNHWNFGCTASLSLSLSVLPSDHSSMNESSGDAQR